MPDMTQVSRGVLQSVTLEHKRSNDTAPFCEKVSKKPMCSVLSHLAKPGVFVSETQYGIRGVCFGR